MKKLFFILLLTILPINVFAQDNESEDQKQWYSISRVGDDPPAKSIGVDLIEYARMIGTVGEDDGFGNPQNVCWAASTDNWADYDANYHNCLTLVGLVSSGSGVSINTIDGSSVPGDGSENGMKTFGLVYGWDGAEFDPVPVTANGGLQVGIEEWPNSFDFANGWQKFKKEEVGVDAPAKTAGTAVDDSAGGDSGDIVLASEYTLNNPNWCVVIKNAGGGSADDLFNAYVFVSPSGSAGEWESLTWDSCDTLGSGDGTCSFCCSECAYAYVKVEAICDTGDDTTVDAWYTANKS